MYNKKINLKTLKLKIKYDRFIINMLIPTVIVCLALLIMAGITYQKNLAFQKSVTLKSLNNIFDECEYKLNSLTNFSKAIQSSDIVFDNSDVPEQYAAIKRLENIFGYVDSLYIYNQAENKVTTKEGVYNANDFFEHTYVYQNYDYNYWNSFNIYYSQNNRILSPTTISFHGGTQKNIVPFLYRNGYKNFIIANIGISDLIESKYVDYLTENTKLYILNKHTNEIFTQDGNCMQDDTIPKQLIKRLLVGKINSFYWKVNGEKCLISSYSSNDSVIGYTYFAVLPLSDLKKNVFPDFIISLTVVFLLVVLAWFLLYKNGTTIYKNLKEILGLLSHTSDSQNDILSNVKEAAYESQKLSTKFSNVLPYVTEKYLVDMLNSNDIYIPQEAIDVLSKSTVFQGSYFMVTIINFIPTEQLFDTYTSLEFENIKVGLFNVIKDIFSLDFQTFVIPTNQNVFYVVLNMKNTYEAEKTEDIIKNMNNTLINDKDLINMKCFKSALYEGLAGLKQAHSDVTQKYLNKNEEAESFQLDFSSKSNINFSDRDENELFSALISFNRQQTYAIINRILEKNIDTPSSDIKKLYNHLLNTLMRVMRIKKISFFDNRSDYEIINICLSKPVDKAYASMLSLIDKVLEYGSKISEPVNYKDIIKYIDKNYSNSELSLKFLEEEFQIKQSTFSMAIKEITGIGFHKYLVNIRIKHAKELLKDTDMNIKQIYEKCGFTSQQTFYRMFKTETGMTPTQYRENQ